MPRPASSMLLGGLAADALGHDAVTAAYAAQNAAQNNRQMHPDEIVFLHDEERVARFIAYYKETTGESLSQAEALAYLDRYGSAKEDKSWNAIYVVDEASQKAFELTSAFIQKESANAYYLDSKGNRHSMFVSSPEEYKNATINLKALFEQLSVGNKEGPYYAAVKQWKENTTILAPNAIEMYAEGEKAGRLAVGEWTLKEDSKSFWDTLKGLPGFIKESINDSEVEPYDSDQTFWDTYLLLGQQGRWFEAGYMLSFNRLFPTMRERGRLLVGS